MIARYESVVFRCEGDEGLTVPHSHAISIAAETFSTYRKVIQTRVTSDESERFASDCHFTSGRIAEMAGFYRGG